MGSAVSSETAAKVDELQRAGKSNAEVFEELKAAGLVGGELLARSPDELAAEYAAGRKTELAPGEWKSADAIIDAVVAQKVDGTLDLGSMGRGADDEPPGLLRMNGIPPLSAVPRLTGNLIPKLPSRSLPRASHARRLLNYDAGLG